MLGKSEWTIRQWEANFIENGYEVPESKQGRYQQSGILWSSEELNRKAAKYVHENANVNGQPNLTAPIFCQWVNESLIPNSNLEPGFPRRILVETARQWLHHLGFETLSKQRDVSMGMKEMKWLPTERLSYVKWSSLASCIQTKLLLLKQRQHFRPTYYYCQLKCGTRLVFFHDESTFLANDDQCWQWGTKGELMIRPKSKGSGIMVSDFVDKRNGYLQLTNEEFERAQSADPTIKQRARVLLEYGESRDGYWTRDKFISQMEHTAKIAEAKYPKHDGWKHVWIFKVAATLLWQTMPWT